LSVLAFWRVSTGCRRPVGSIMFRNSNHPRPTATASAATGEGWGGRRAAVGASVWAGAGRHELPRLPVLSCGCTCSTFAPSRHKHAGGEAAAVHPLPSSQEFLSVQNRVGEVQLLLLLLLLLPDRDTATASASTYSPQRRTRHCRRNSGASCSVCLWWREHLRAIKHTGRFSVSSVSVSVSRAAGSASPAPRGAHGRHPHGALDRLAPFSRPRFCLCLCLCLCLCSWASTGQRGEGCAEVGDAVGRGCGDGRGHAGATGQGGHLGGGMCMCVMDG